MALRTRGRRGHLRRSRYGYGAYRYVAPRPRRRPRRPSRLGLGPWPWLLAGAGAAVGLVFLVPLLLAAFRWLFAALGLGLPLVVLTLAADAWLLWRLGAAGPPLSWRRWLGLHLLLAAILGALGLLAPPWRFAGSSLGDLSAGGRAGAFLTGSLPGLLGWLAATLGAVWALEPRSVRLAVRGAALTGRWLLSLDIPSRSWRGLRAFLVWLGSLLPSGEEDSLPELSPRREGPPLVPRWDEEWEPLPEPSAPAASPKAAQEKASREEKREKEEEAVPRRRRTGNGWELPPLELLNQVSDESRPPDNEARAQLIVDTLRSFGVDARVVSIQQGPTVTQFGVEPGWEVKTRQVQERDDKGRPVYDKDGRPRYRTEVVSRTRVRVNRITALANDLALALAAPSIRIEAPVPGKPIVGIEVPNSAPSVVTLRSVIESSNFQKLASRSRLAIALGKGVSGEPVPADLARMPHLLIAGATGSGKSVCINSIIACLLMHNTPDEVRFVLIDPKRVELAAFASIPHLVFSKVIVDVEEVPGTLQAVIQEMEGRYRTFASLGVRDIEAYNRSPKAPEKLPYWVVIIDELADLMMAAPYQVEKQLCRLAQLARATGIHLIVATQRPSVDVVTGLIKANFPTRIAFAVSSQVDSRTIIDMAGAEKLLGRGDMLFLPTDAAKPRRLQGCYVSDAEIDRIVAWWSDERFRHLRPEPLDHLLLQAQAEGGGLDDPLFEAARELAMQHNRISPSMLQRRLNVGRERAVRLMRALEEMGIVAPSDDPLASRRVLVRGDDEDYF